MKSLQIFFIVFCFALCFALSNGQVNSGDGAQLDPCVKFNGNQVQNDCKVCGANNDICPDQLSSCFADSDYNAVMSTVDTSNCYVICIGPSGSGEQHTAAVVCGNSISEYLNPEGVSYSSNSLFADFGAGSWSGLAGCTCGGALKEGAPVVESQQQSIIGGGYVYQGPYPWSTLGDSHHKDSNLQSYNPSFSGKQFFINHISYQYLKSNALREVRWSHSDISQPVNNWFYRWTGGSTADLTNSWKPTADGYKSFDGSGWTPVPKSDVHYAGSPPNWFPSTSEPVSTGFLVIIPADETWIWMVDGFGFCISGFTKTSSSSWLEKDNLINCGLNSKDWGYGEFPRAELWQEAPMMIKSEMIYSPGDDNTTPKVTYWHNIYPLKQPGSKEVCMESSEFGNDVFLSCTFKALSHFIAPTSCLSGITYSKSSSMGSPEPAGPGGGAKSPCFEIDSDQQQSLIDQMQPYGSGQKWESGAGKNDVAITRNCAECTEINKNTNDYYVSLGSSGINIGVNYTFYKYGSTCKKNCPPDPFGGIANGCLFVKGVMFDCNECVIEECAPGTFRPLGYDGCDCIPCSGENSQENTCIDPTPYWDSDACKCTGCIDEYHVTTTPRGNPLPGCDAQDKMCYAQGATLCDRKSCPYYGDGTCEFGHVSSCTEFADECCPCKECDAQNYLDFKPNSCSEPTHQWMNDCTCKRCAYSKDDNPKPKWDDNDQRWCGANEDCTKPPSCKPPSCGDEFENTECGSSNYDGVCGCEPCSNNWPEEGTVDQVTGRLHDGSCAEGWYLPDEWVGQDCRPCQKCEECPPGTQPVGYKQSPPEAEQLDIFIYVD